MCGQAGAYSSSSLSQFEIDRVSKLLVLNHFRGEDSTGAMWYHRHRPVAEQYGMLKRNEHPFYFGKVTYPKEIDKGIFKASLPHMFAVHCRAATVGKVSAENAHPFEHGNIIGMHNGTIHGDFTNKDAFDTDSEALYFNIATMGVEAAIKDLPTSAAYALVWVNKEDNTLNFLRNQQRPLHIWHAGATIYWTSAYEDLEYVMNRTSSTHKSKTSAGITKDETLYLSVDTHYKIDMNKTGEIEWTTQTLKPERKASVTVNDGGAWNQNGFFPRANGGNGTHSQGNTKSTSTKTGTTGSGNEPEFPAWSINSLIWKLLTEPLESFKQYGFYVSPEYQKKSSKFYYAIELDMWFPLVPYLTLCMWRHTHKDEFVEAVKERFLHHTRTYQKKVFKMTGLTRNKYKALIRGRYSDYILEPYIVDDEGVIKDIPFMESDFQKAERAAKGENVTAVIPFRGTEGATKNSQRSTSIALAARAAAQDRLRREAAQLRKDAIDGVDHDLNDELPWNDPEAPSDDLPEAYSAGVVGTSPDGHLMYGYGVNAYGTRAEITEVIRSGCCWCPEIYGFTDLPDLFWVSNDSYLCPSCQDKVVDGEIQADVIPRYHLLPAFVAYRETKEAERDREALQSVIIN